MSYDVTYDIVRRRGSSHDICEIDVQWRHTTSSMIVWCHKTQSRIVRHRTTVIRSSYNHRATLIYKAILAPRNKVVCHRTTIVRLSYDAVRFAYALASHQAIIVKSYVIVRLSLDSRTMSYDVVRCSTMQYDVVRFHRNHAISEFMQLYISGEKITILGPWKESSFYPKTENLKWFAMKTVKSTKNKTQAKALNENSTPSPTLVCIKCLLSDSNACYVGNTTI